MTKRELKDKAQSDIMHALMTVHYAQSDAEASPELKAETQKQIERIEKFLGFEPGSWRD